MRLQIDQRFAGVSVERFLQLYLSEDFNNAVAPVSGLKSRALVDEKVRDDGVRERRVRMEPAVTLPGPVQKLVDALAGRSGAVITYDEVSLVDPARHEIRFRIDSKANERVRFEGTIRVVDDSNGGGAGIRRIIDGVIEVKAPIGLGGVIERFIEAETQKGYVKIAAFLQRWITEHPP